MDMYIFNISTALPWVKNPWYPLDRGAPRTVVSVMKKRKVSYHCRNCTLDCATLSL